MAERAMQIDMLQLHRRGEQQVGIVGGIGGELLVDHEEQIIASQTRKHPLLIRADRRGI